MGRASARLDADGLICVLYVCKESTVFEHAHRALIVEKFPVWIKLYRLFVNVVRYLVKARAWRGLGVVVVFVVELRVVLCLSVAIVLFVFDVNI